MNSRVFAAAGLLGLLPLAQALPVQSWSEAASPSRDITTVSSNATAQAMDGAVATVFFSDGSSDQATFAGTAIGSDYLSLAQTSSFQISAGSVGGVVSRPDFSIVNLDASRTVVGFAIDGRGAGSGRAAFDRALGPGGVDTGTAGSATGVDLTLDFTGRSFLTGTVDITYSHPLTLNGAAPAGDLFGSIEVRMAFGTILGLPPSNQFSGVFSDIDFGTDVDTVDYAAVAVVPEPGSIVLLLASLAALALLRRPRAGG